MKVSMTLSVSLFALISAHSLMAQGTQYRVAVSAENVAPNRATFQTPVWIGFHDGTFDSYDGGSFADELPIPGSQALERLAEDGNTEFISADFDTLGVGSAQATLPGPDGPIGPGARARGEFLLDSLDPRARYFSYASMIIPSNDAFIANGNPMAHQVFDKDGKFVARNFFAPGGPGANDAGTEVNDEIPENTAFFGQMKPDTGVTERVVISDHPGFNPFGSGGILDDNRFSDGLFLDNGYSFMRFQFRASVAITDNRGFSTFATGDQQVPPVDTDAVALGRFRLAEGGTQLRFFVIALGLEDLVAAHLHAGNSAENGPVAVDLLDSGELSQIGPSLFLIRGEVDSSSLTGPLAGFPLDELSGQATDGGIYLNLHSSENPSGEVRGQLAID